MPPFDEKPEPHAERSGSALSSIPDEDFVDLRMDFTFERMVCYAGAGEKFLVNVACLLATIMFFTPATLAVVTLITADAI